MAWLRSAIPIIDPVQSNIQSGVDTTELHAIEEKGANQSPDTYKEKTDADKQIAELFDSVTVAQFEKMFPDNRKWARHAERAARNGLIDSRLGRGKFNPYWAARWWLKKGQAVGIGRDVNVH